MRYYRYLTLGIFMAMSMSACYNTSNYHGDGYLEDRGILEASWRYVLTIEEIEIGVPGIFDFQLFQLPPKIFHFGMEIDLPEVEHDESVQDYLPCNPRIYFKIVDRLTKKEVMNAGGHIASDWTWNIPAGGKTAFVYVWRNGETSFRPTSHDRGYAMEVRVDGLSEEFCELKATLVAKSPGWK